MDHVEIKTVLARHDERIQSLEEWRKDHGRVLEKIDQRLERLEQTYGSRPTWAVTIIITLLTSLVGTLATYIITHS